MIAAAVETLYFREFENRFNNEKFNIINDKQKLTKEKK